MSVDTILFAVTKLQRRISTQPAYSEDTAEEKRSLTLTLDYLRDQLKRNDPVAFTNTINSGLAAQPDRYDFILGELYNIMGVSTRERFDELLACDWL